MDEITRAKREAWDECVRELFISAARGKILIGEDNAGWELPANPYRSDDGLWAREKHAEALTVVQGRAWDQGYQAAVGGIRESGHDVNVEYDFPATVNPYSK